jgi:hypothetical protein
MNYNESTCGDYKQKEYATHFCLVKADEEKLFGDKPL